MADLLIANALIVDGSGEPGRLGSVLVRGDRIEAILAPGEGEPSSARRIDAAGHVVAPGFVDPHSHSDMSPFVEPTMDSLLRQGVTTAIVGNCGGSAFPTADADDMLALAGGPADAVDTDWRTFGGYVERVDLAGPAVNVAALVGHGTLRAEVMGADQRRAPTPDELDAMRRLLASAVEDGSVGLSTGLIYQPGLHASTEEIVALAEVMGGTGALYASHVRGEGATVFDAVRECIGIGALAGVPSHVSHLKVEGRPRWGRAGELLELLDRARASGDDVSADQYPYTAWETELAACLPPSTTVEELPALLEDHVSRGRLLGAMEQGEPGWESIAQETGWDLVVIGAHTPDPALSGRTIAAVAAERSVEPAALVCDLLLADRFTGMIGHGMHEDDVREIAARPDVFVGTDGVAISPDGPLGGYAVHPRYYGTFPRVLARYVRGDGVLTLEAAVRKMSALPAARFGLAGRGVLQAGAFADLVVFDPASVRDTATFERPHAFADGIELVVVNGRVAWDGTPGERAGRALRRGER